jgi:WD40 repeat protein
VLKLADPVTCGCYLQERNMLLVGAYDRMVRFIDLSDYSIAKSFPAASESLTFLTIHDNKVFVASCENVFRSYDLATGDAEVYEGHTGWVNSIIFRNEEIITAGEDR